ncbi:NgoFVII family restriction endonuclease [Clostridium sporogenes]|uniref:NgoFVII family restriction endonuclease n=1 Tax=Clostridium cibarium TaxID=2762247 RepID=A0ABR8PSE2_9CLOT|nr:MULTISPECIES: restriction endonuclease PLD domain-containing protein [Bacillota]MBD7911089.1 NgoFVII family restriction endonuclease [Clostridium cibarium]NFG95790.1 NgoFVII family restriction endonuclease [Clostridium sporogenes]NFH33460.1 NgoFVII family restriction endonuclease [Clostridium sporogenes]NFH48577.1 NgoFVII family restriction endonuclease [Clostridium sporogenes]NFL19300.1 NgoFVII family restriction endonuclease [Clostridium sporogenes]
MKLLYSNILPLGTSEGQQTIIDCFNEQIAKSDRVEIAVGYISRAALEELDNLVEEHNISNICLTIGMYFIEGMPEGSYNTALEINKKWTETGIGEIKIVKAFKYHGKVYCFYKDGQPFSSIIGSANLGVIKLDANNRRQYEISSITDDATECKEIAEFLEKLKAQNCSDNIANITGMPIIREINTSLSGIDTVTQIPQTGVQLYEQHKTDVSFVLPLKVPAYDERHMDDGKHFTKSNINVSYAAPRSKRKSRDWYETQLTVSKAITRSEGYPEKNKPFFVVTDDGYWFKAHTTSDGNKQFSAVGDELILGRWIKGRLAAAGLVTPVNDTQADTDRKGMITKEMLQAYGCDSLVLSKTDQKALDEDGTELDVWVLSFETITNE